MKILHFFFFSKTQNFTTEENTELLETKLVDIMEDFHLDDNNVYSIVKEKEENSLILVSAQRIQSMIQNQTKLSSKVCIQNQIVNFVSLFGFFLGNWRNKSFFSSNGS